MSPTMAQLESGVGLEVGASWVRYLHTTSAGRTHLSASRQPMSLLPSKRRTTATKTTDSMLRSAQTAVVDGMGQDDDTACSTHVQSCRARESIHQSSACKQNLGKAEDETMEWKEDASVHGPLPTRDYPRLPKALSAGASWPLRPIPSLHIRFDSLAASRLRNDFIAGVLPIMQLCPLIGAVFVVVHLEGQHRQVQDAASLFAAMRLPPALHGATQAR